MDKESSFRGLRLIEVRGSRRERGRQYGEACRDTIVEFVNLSIEELNKTVSLPLETIRSEMQNVIQSVKRLTPWLLEECFGIAEGAGCEIHEIVYLQCRFEMLHQFHSEASCTVLGIGAERTNGKGPLVAQNVDLPPFNSEAMVLLKTYPDKGPQILTLTFAGILAQEGINSEGLALCGSHILSKNWRRGYPARNFLRRHLLEQPTVQDVEREVQSITPRGSGHNIIVGDRTGKVVNFEITPDTYRANLLNLSGFRVHTNHHVHSELRDLDWFMSHDQEYYMNSVTRLQRAEDLLYNVQGEISLDVLRMVLSDHENIPDAICRHSRNDRFGNTSVVCLAGVPIEGKLHVIPSNPCEGIWKTYAI